MSGREGQPFKTVDEGIRAVEAFWKVKLPSLFRSLYTAGLQFDLSPCDFFTLEEMAGGEGRSYGQMPQFLPFGRLAGEDSLYGFYLAPQSIDGFWPVVYWDEGEMFLRPVASDFEAFLRYCVISGRYSTDDDWPDSLENEADKRERNRINLALNLPESLFTDPVSRNDTELYQRLVSVNPQDSVSLAHLGCAARNRGEDERALDFFHRSSEAAHWFGDPCYLMADIYRLRENELRAVQGWWSVMQRPVAFCTRTWEWDLGTDHPDAEIYEIAADALSQFAHAAPPEMTQHPLWRAVTREDPYDPDVREDLAKHLLTAGDLPGAERELLSTLFLAQMENIRQTDRVYQVLSDLYDRQGRHREYSLAQFDCRLPHPRP